MALSDCIKCWETPCVCKGGTGCRHLSINELRGIKGGIEKLIADKTERKLNPDAREQPQEKT